VSDDLRECHEEVADRDGYAEPCEKPAVGWRIDPEENHPYPVCVTHHRWPYADEWVDAQARLDAVEALVAAHALLPETSAVMGQAHEPSDVVYVPICVDCGRDVEPTAVADGTFITHSVAGQRDEAHAALDRVRALLEKAEASGIPYWQNVHAAEVRAALDGPDE